MVNHQKRIDDAAKMDGIKKVLRMRFIQLTQQMAQANVNKVAPLVALISLTLDRLGEELDGAYIIWLEIATKI